MTMIRMLLNNGFFVLFLMVAATIYIAYGEQPTQETKTAEVKTQAQATMSKTVATAQKAKTPTETPKHETTKHAVVPKKPKAAMSPIPQQTKHAEVTPKPKTELAPVTEQKTVAVEPSPKKPTNATKAKRTTTSEDDDEEISIPETEALPQPNMQVLAQFKTPQAALNAARAAFYKKDYLTAEKIYFALAFKTKQPDVVGELANTLYADKKTDWAEQAWLKSAQLLVQTGRINHAMILANRLQPVAPNVSKKIRKALQAMQQERMAKAEAAAMKQQNRYTPHQKAQIPQIPSHEPQEARIKAYQKQMQAYQQKLKAYYQHLAAQQPQGATREAQMAKMKAYQQQMQAYQAKMRAYQMAQQKRMMKQAPYMQPQRPQH